MNSSAAYVASVAFFTLLLCNPGVAQLESSAVSQDGTQRGSIRVSEDSTTTRGSVSSSSVGGNQAFASSSLTIGPTGTQASFTAQGDDQSVSRTVVTGEPSTSGDEDTSSATEIPAAVLVSTASALPSVVATPETIKEDKEAEDSEAPAVVPETTQSDEDSEHKKVCVINDQEEFERQLDLGNEVTHVKAHGDDVEIVTEQRTNYGATRTSLVTRYIPDNIHEQCGVTYADLGLEDREGDGYSSLSTSQSASYHYTASSATDSPRSADYIRQSVLESLCSQDFFRNFALYQECSTYPTKQPW